MIEVSTTKTQPGYSLPVTLVSVDPNQVLYPPWGIDFYVYPIHRRTQVVRKERDKGLLDNSSRRFIWKQFENYKISSGNPDKFNVTYWDQARGFPPAHVYRSVPPIPTAYAAYWYWTTLSGGPYEPFGEAGKLNRPTTVSGRTLCPPFFDRSENGDITPVPEDLNNLQIRACRSMLPSIKEELSLLNSLYELKDFRSLPTFVKSLTRASTHARFIKKYLSKSPGSNTKTLGELSRKAAGGFLQWNFAISPLISDIRSIRTALNSYRSRINDQVTKTGGMRTKHFSLALYEFEDSDESIDTGYLQPYLGLNGCVIYNARRRIYYEPTLFHSQISYNYNYTGYQRQHAATLALLDSLGLNFSLKRIWDALPWTFVIDWVLKVGDSLDQFSVRNMEPQINIHQYLWSVKRSRRIAVDVGPGPATALDNLLDRSRVSLPLVREESYGRFLNMPVSPSLVEASGLSSKEFSLAAALVIAQKRKRKHAR